MACFLLISLNPGHHTARGQQDVNTELWCISASNGKTKIHCNNICGQKLLQGFDEDILLSSEAGSKRCPAPATVPGGATLGPKKVLIRTPAGVSAEEPGEKCSYKD